MANYWLNILNSVVTFTSIFLVFSLVLSFWGRLALGLTKLEKSPKLGHPLTMLTGSTLVMFVGWCLCGVVDNYRNYLLIVLYSGFALLTLELLFWRLPSFLRQKDKKIFFARLIASHQPLMAGIILALIFSFFHSAIWESGQMDVWLFGSTDYLSWSMCADYWLGLADPVALNLSYNVELMTWDSIGSHMLLAMWALASGKTALFAISGFMIAMVIWVGLSIQSLMKRFFDLGFLSRLVISLSAIGGIFFNYLIFKGAVGHLVSITAYLLALKEILSWRGQPNKKEVSRFFIPIFSIFLAYQGAFVAFVFFLGLSAIVSYFCHQEVIKPWPRRAWAAFSGGLKPILVTVLVSFIMSPFLTWHLYIRSYQTAFSVSGWKISFLSPWLLSGLPVYKPDFFLKMTDQVAIFWYLPFFALLLGLGYLVNKSFQARGTQSDRSSLINIDIIAINIIIIMFIISIIMYIVGFYIFDNRYQVWKFVAYVGLPLSFIFLALLVLAARDLKSLPFRGFIFGSVAFLTLVFGLGLDNFKNITKAPKLFYGSMSANSFFSVFSKIVNSSAPGTRFILNFEDPADTYFAAEIFKNNQKFIFSTSMYANFFFNTSSIFSMISSKNSKFKILSDRNYDIFFNNSPGKREIGQIYVHDQDWVKARGFIEILGINRSSDWRLIKDWVLLKILAPEFLKSQNFVLTARLRGHADNPASCQPKARFVIARKADFVLSQDDIGNLKALVDSSSSGQGFIIASILLDYGSNVGINLGCVYYFQGVDIEPL